MVGIMLVFFLGPGLFSGGVSPVSFREGAVGVSFCLGCKWLASSSKMTRTNAFVSIFLSGLHLNCAGFSWVAIAQLFQSQATLLNLGGRIRDGESGCGVWPEDNYLRLRQHYQMKEVRLEMTMFIMSCSVTNVA